MSILSNLYDVLCQGPNTNFTPINWETAYFNQSNGGYRVFGKLVVVRAQAYVKTTFTAGYLRTIASGFIAPIGVSQPLTICVYNTTGSGQSAGGYSVANCYVDGSGYLQMANVSSNITSGKYLLVQGIYWLS